MTGREKNQKWMLAGLGNPGEDYEHTYHNAGALFLEYVATERMPGGVWKKESKFCSMDLGWILLAIPATYMNVSGTAIQAALRTRHVRTERLILAHDDTDIPLGTYRLQFGRGAAGHHGVESVIAALGTKEFFRLRIGTQTARAQRKKAGDIALRRRTKLHEKILYGAFSGMNEGMLKLIQNETS